MAHIIRTLTISRLVIISFNVQARRLQLGRKAFPKKDSGVAHPRRQDNSYLATWLSGRDGMDRSSSGCELYTSAAPHRGFRGLHDTVRDPGVELIVADDRSL
ncbi:hypothetical protein J6590_048637 [Homalodisca vitripennis]|nr:hypothetical protein J6590_048637 [Homalodisca vitripennis]